MQPVKLKEVWRDPLTGAFAKAPEPVVVEVAEPKPKNANDVVGAVTLLSSVGFLGIYFAVIFWRVSLSLIAGTAIVYLIQAYIKNQKQNASRPKLQVNEQGKSTTIYL